jgi:hypothetical protein
MTLHISTGLRNGLLVTGSLKSQLDGGSIKIYSGPVPANADAALSGNTLLCTVTVASGATQLSFDTTPSDGTLAKPSAVVWSGANAATGTASFYRHVAAGDAGDASTTAPRIQGDVALYGGELNLTSTALVSGATQTIDYYAVNIPTL